jgi:hypothetical protein
MEHLQRFVDKDRFARFQGTAYRKRGRIEELPE